MTSAVYWIIVRERRAQSQPHSLILTSGSRGKTVSGHLELSPNVVDDHDFCCALSCSPCSTTCCNSNDFLCPSCRSRLYITGTGKSRYDTRKPVWIQERERKNRHDFYSTPASRTRGPRATARSPEWHRQICRCYATFFPILSSQLIKRSSFEQFLVLKKNI